MPSNRAASVSGCKTSNLISPQHGLRRRWRRWLSFGVSVMSKDKLSGEQIKKIIEEATADARSKKGSANGDRGKSWKDGLITARELQTKQFEPVRIILPDLIPEGVTVLAGKPKIGKSWFALDVCVAVAGGRFVLGEVKPVQGYVLYLALEDSPRRLKKRMEKI